MRSTKQKIAIKRLDGKYTTPNEALPISKLDERYFLPFGQHEYTVDTTPLEKNLHERALKAQYLRAKQAGQFIFLLPKTNKTKLIRVREFMLPATYDKEI